MSKAVKNSKNGVKMIGYKATTDEYQEIKSQAEQRDLSLSGFLRLAVRALLKNGEKRLESSLEKDSISLEKELERADSELLHLRQQLDRRDEHIEVLAQTLDQNQQLLAVQTQNSAALTDQLNTSQLMLADLRKRPVGWKRVFRWT